MTQMSGQGSVVPVQPQPNIYTLLVIVAILALLVTVGVVLRNLMGDLPAGYALDIGTIYKGGGFPQ